MTERAFLRYRLDVVSGWAESAFKRVTLDAIQSRIWALDALERRTVW
jgi:hypothetical protein